MTKYKAEDFKKWLEIDEKRKKDLPKSYWNTHFFTYWLPNKDNNFDRLLETTQGINTSGLYQGDSHQTIRSIVKNWISEVDKEVDKKSETQQLKELSEILFPNQPYNFTQLKQEITRLKVKELSPQLREGRTELEKLITDSKNKVGTSFEKIIDFLLETQKQISEQKEENELVQAQLKGQLIAYQNILETNLSKEELKTLLNKKSELIILEKQLTLLQIQEAHTEIIPK